jgi:serine/threonine protein kinase
MSRPSWIGQTLGERYQILEMVGQGGMSAVYKARDPNLQRVVAIKMMHGHLGSDPKFQVRFEDEARAVAQLRHPNIVQVYDYNSDEDVSYMVQEFVPGETLQTRLRRLNHQGRHLPLEEVFKICQDILGALGYAHQRGMIHRDIKPANIILDVHGQAILMDFGIVKITGGESHTATGAVVGTAMYMSPELIRGEQADERSDLYSLGVTLFEMLSGRPPFEAESAMTLMMMHLNDPVPDVSSLRPDLPSGLAAVIGRALSKDRSARFNSAAEMIAALERVQASLAASMPDPSTQVDLEPPSAASPPAVPAPAAVEPQAETPVPASVSPAAPPESPPGAPSTVPEKPAAREPAQPAPSPAAREQVNPPYLVYGGVGALMVVLVLAGIWIGRMFGGGNEVETQPAGSVENTPLALLAGEISETPEPTPTPSQEPTATFTVEPTATYTPTMTPTLSALPLVTPPADRHFARINGISLDEQNRYVVDYETFGYTEVLPGEHVHFFFNTVPPEQAGHPGSGPWYLYGGPRPFREYTANSRPANAAAVCVLVANPDHSVQPESGNCWPLPDVPVLTALEEGACYSYPAVGYQQEAWLPQWSMLLVRGRLPEGGWWYVQNPEDLVESCWVPAGQIYLSGDLALIADATPQPGAGGSSTP